MGVLIDYAVMIDRVSDWLSTIPLKKCPPPFFLTNEDGPSGTTNISAYYKLLDPPICFPGKKSDFSQ